MPSLSKRLTSLSCQVGIFFAVSSFEVIGAFSPSLRKLSVISQPLSSASIASPQIIRANRCIPRSSLIRTLTKINRKKLCSLPSDESDSCISVNDEDIDGFSQTCWNPNLRKTLGGIASIGALETAYLTYDKIQYSSGASSSLVDALCSSGDGASESSCNDVLHGPYASITLGSGGLDIPLSSLGFGAYMLVLVLAVFPLVFPVSTSNPIDGDSDGAKVLDGDNRIVLLGMTTFMASFSVYLITILLRVLHASCLFCFLSAGLSISLAGLSWFCGMLPSHVNESITSYKNVDVMEFQKRGLTAGATSIGVATIIALGLFLTVDEDFSDFNNAVMASTNAESSALLASTSSNARFERNKPPPITTTSSREALALASDMSNLNSRMFGAFWCSHCYDQKQTLGYEAMQTIPYIECDREGFRNQRDLCKEREVPGYPTWEIGGELFPGERSLDELREIVDGAINKEAGK